VFKVGIVGWSAGGELIGRRGSVVTGWRRMGGGGERGESRRGRAERINGKENNLL
jgi:hypothetical protein